MTYQNLRNAIKAIIRERFITLNAYTRKKKDLISVTQTTRETSTLRNQKKKNKMKPKKAEVNESITEKIVEKNQ